MKKEIQKFFKSTSSYKLFDRIKIFYERIFKKSKFIRKESRFQSKKNKTEFFIHKNIKSNSNIFNSSVKDPIIQTDPVLFDFLNKLKNLVLQENEEIPSLTRIYHKEELISETFNEVEKNQILFFIVRFFVFETQKKN